MNYNAPRGTKDILPTTSKHWQYLADKFADVCQRFSYKEIRTPTFEQTELFARSVGDSTDIVQKEMYNFVDKGGREMTLRPEGTAGVVRAYLENGLSSEPTPLKLYYVINAFRYEKMQKGRYREFYQMGCECFGSESATVDAELISLLWLFFSELGLSHLALHVNSVGCPHCRPLHKEQLQTYLQPKLPELCEDCQRRYTTNPLRILDCKEEACQRATQDAPVLRDYLCADCKAHLEEFLSLLSSFEITYNFNDRLVRGLDYYTRSVFEFVSENVGSQGSICGGGRYDGLVEVLGGSPTPGVGFALGVERLLLELAAQNIVLPDYEPPTIFLVTFPAYRTFAHKFCYRLRSAGIHAEVDIVNRSFKAQMKHANRLQAQYILVIGEDELKKNCGKIKRMSDGEELFFTFDALVQFLMNK